MFQIRFVSGFCLLVVVCVLNLCQSLSDDLKIRIQVHPRREFSAHTGDYVSFSVTVHHFNNANFKEKMLVLVPNRQPIESLPSLMPGAQLGSQRTFYVNTSVHMPEDGGIWTIQFIDEKNIKHNMSSVHVVAMPTYDESHPIMWYPNEKAHKYMAIGHRPTCPPPDSDTIMDKGKIVQFKPNLVAHTAPVFKCSVRNTTARSYCKGLHIHNAPMTMTYAEPPSVEECLEWIETGKCTRGAFSVEHEYSDETLAAKNKITLNKDGTMSHTSNTPRYYSNYHYLCNVWGRPHERMATNCIIETSLMTSSFPYDVLQTGEESFNKSGVIGANGGQGVTGRLYTYVWRNRTVLSNVCKYAHYGPPVEVDIMRQNTHTSIHNGQDEHGNEVVNVTTLVGRGDSTVFYSLKSNQLMPSRQSVEDAMGRGCLPLSAINQGSFYMSAGSIIVQVFTEDDLPFNMMTPYESDPDILRPTPEGPDLHDIGPYVPHLATNVFYCTYNPWNCPSTRRYVLNRRLKRDSQDATDIPIPDNVQNELDRLDFVVRQFEDRMIKRTMHELCLSHRRYWDVMNMLFAAFPSQVAESMLNHGVSLINSGDVKGMRVGYAVNVSSISVIPTMRTTDPRMPKELLYRGAPVHSTMCYGEPIVRFVVDNRTEYGQLVENGRRIESYPASTAKCKDQMYEETNKEAMKHLSMHKVGTKMFVFYDYELMVNVPINTLYDNGKMRAWIQQHQSRFVGDVNAIAHVKAALLEVHALDVAEPVALPVRPLQKFSERSLPLYTMHEMYSVPHSYFELLQRYNRNQLTLASQFALLTLPNVVDATHGFQSLLHDAVTFVEDTGGNIVGVAEGMVSHVLNSVVDSLFSIVSSMGLQIFIMIGACGGILFILYFMFVLLPRLIALAKGNYGSVLTGENLDTE